MSEANPSSRYRLYFNSADHCFWVWIFSASWCIGCLKPTVSRDQVTVEVSALALSCVPHYSVLRLYCGRWGRCRSFLTRERLIKVYFRHNRVRVVLKNLLTYSMLTNFLRAPLPCPDENILLIRGSLGISIVVPASGRECRRVHL